MFENLSVIVVSWNRADMLEACLDAAVKALPGAQFIVVDNGSEPPLTPRLGMQWLRSQKNLGFAGGCNLAFDFCTRSRLLLLNNDVLLSSGAPIGAMLRCMEQSPDVAALQPTIRLPDGTLDTCGENLTPIGTLSHRGYRQPPGELSQRESVVFAAKGACMLLRVRAVRQAGGLFRSHFFCYYEDIDLCHRLWLAGYEVRYLPTEPVLHDEGSSARLLPRKDIWRRYLSNMLTSACDLWGWRLWLFRGLPFLLAVYAGGLLRGVLPRPQRSRLPLRRRVSEKDFLARVTDRVPLSYYLMQSRK